MHSRILCRFCCNDMEESALRLLEDVNDIDILYNDGAILKVVITKNQVSVLKATLEYFEKTQFPTKDDKYVEAHEKLIEILDEVSDGVDSASEMHTIIAKYTGSDIARLDDLDDMDNDDGSGEIADTTHNTPPNTTEHGTVVSSTSTTALSSIGDCIEAAKTGDSTVIRQKLDITNHSHKLMVVSTSIQYHKVDTIVPTLLDMASNNPQKATILRLAGNVCAQSELFQEAEKYYKQSLSLHPNYYITYAKIGSLYQLWSDDHSVEHNQKLQLRKSAIENYGYALAHKPTHIHDTEKQELDIVSKQLGILQSHISDTDDTDVSDTESRVELGELLSSYFSSEDEVDRSIAVTGEINFVA